MRLPVEYGAAERFAMRLLFAIAVAQQIPASLAHLSLSKPNGLARLVDLRLLLDPQLLAGARYVLWAALLLYVLRVAWAIVLPYITLLSIAVGSVNNSAGAISHNFQILSLVLVAQTGAYYYARLFRKGEGPAGAENWMVFWSQQAIAATYLTSAITKLVNSSGRWFADAPLIAVQIVKTTEQSYYNTLDESARASGMAIAEWVVRHPVIVISLLTAGFFLELLAPFALLGRRFALFFGLGLLAFHATVERIMKLNFAQNEYLLWIYLVNVPFWALLAWGAINRRSARVRRLSSPAV